MAKNEQSAVNGTQPDDVDLDTMDEDTSAQQKLNSSTDPSQIKFTSVNLSDKNGEAKVDILVAQTSIGMGKEELMKYANEPFWVRLRMILFVLFWVGWLAMLVGAVFIIIMAPRCPPTPKVEWYQKNTMYQVDVEVFKDGDGDGIGDFKGLISKLNYFKNLNIKTLLLSAFYSMAPISGGIMNHTAIDKKFGTMSDFEDLVTEIKARDMKLVLDFVPNESSDEHPWFQASVRKEEPYRDFYVWSGAEHGSHVPNNWLSFYGGSTWEWNDERHEYYMHTFGKHSPDLNLRNELVREKLEEVLRFWLDKNVDGFKVKSASHLIHDISLRDEPLQTAKSVSEPKYKDISHIYTLDQDETLELFAEWRSILSNYSGSPKILMAELSGHINNTVRYYGNDTYTLVDFPLNTELTKLNEESLAMDLKEHIDIWVNSTPSYSWPNWVLGNKNTKRLVDRVGQDFIDGLYMVAALLRGTPITYFGDEIAMPSFSIKESETFEVRPMIWNNGTAGGFTNDSSFSFPVSSQAVNVEAALNDKSSHLKIFKRLNELRDQPAINFGKEEFPVISENIFSLMRVKKGSPGYLVAFNMGSNSTVVDFVSKSSHLPETGRLEVRSRNIVSGPLAEGDHPKIKLSQVPLEAKQAAVFSFVPKFED